MANFGSVEIKGYKEIMDLFDPKRIKKIVNRSLYRTARQMRTKASSKIREGYNIRKADLDKSIKVYRGDMVATIKVSGKNLNAIEFGPVSWNRKKAGATVHIKRGTGKLYLHSFQIQRWGGKVFVRVGKKKWEIKPVIGPSAKQLFGDRVIADVLTKTLEERNQVNFDAQLLHETGASIDLPE